jgi:hypothetical protein
MVNITLQGFEFSITPCTRAAFMPTLIALARDQDKPLERFCATLGNLSAADRDAAIRGYMARPDWDTPPVELINQVADSNEGILYLAWHTFSPRMPSIECLEAFIDNDYPAVMAALKKAYKELQPLTDEDILERNKALKEKLCQII